jgi:hypothetical protein
VSGSFAYRVRNGAVQVVHHRPAKGTSVRAYGSFYLTPQRLQAALELVDDLLRAPSHDNLRREYDEVELPTLRKAAKVRLQQRYAGIIVSRLTSLDAQHVTESLSMSLWCRWSLSCCFETRADVLSSKFQPVQKQSGCSMHWPEAALPQKMHACMWTAWTRTHVSSCCS